MCTRPNRVFTWYENGEKFTKWTFGETVHHLELYHDGHVRLAYDDKVSHHVKKVITDSTPVMCYNCEECKLQRTIDKTNRVLMHTLEKGFENAYFVTLTYNEANLPTTDRVNNDGVMYKTHSLNVKDVQKFHKRLRKALYGNAKGELTYFSVGEYGTRNKRPHYHSIYWNLPLDDLVLDTVITSTGKEQYISPFLEKTWKLGRVRVCPVNIATIGYCCGYVQKKLYGDERFIYEKQGIRPPFVIQSKGLGLEYMLKHWKQLYDDGEMYVGTQDGSRTIRPDKYFYDKIIKLGLTSQESYDTLKMRRADVSQSRQVMKESKTTKSRKEYLETIDQLRSKQCKNRQRDF